jgi:multiple sugar transport system permease protein
MAVPGVVLLIPKFLVINQLGLFDSYTGMIIPLMADAAGVFIMKNFFESIPSVLRNKRESTARAPSALSGRWCCPCPCRPS